MVEECWEEVRSCGVSEGSRVEVTSRMTGGGRHKDKKKKAEQKRSVSPVKSEQTRGETKRVITDSEEEDVILRLSEWGVCKAVVDQLAEEDDGVEQKIQWFVGRRNSIR